MAETLILNLYAFFFLLCFCCCCYSYDDDQVLYNTFTVSSFSFAETTLKPYEWRYIRVDLPPWFSSMYLELESDIDLDIESIGKVSRSSLPIICFRDGSPPLPDVSNSSNSLMSGPLSNGSFGSAQNMEQCYPMQKNIVMKLTNEQISPGVYYFGLFNGVGPARTQSKMITRGPSFSFKANISVEGCTSSTMWGPYCNLTVHSLSCSQSSQNNFLGNISSTENNQTSANVVSCQNSINNSCLGDGELQVYSLEVVGMTEELTVTLRNFTYSETPGNSSGFVLMCYARLGAMPLENLHDYSGDINKSPLVIRSPKVGRWYFAIITRHMSKQLAGLRGNTNKVCFSIEWEVAECLVGKAGPDCSWQSYSLQTVLRKNPSVPFESYYLPSTGKVSSDSANFRVEPLLSNSEFGGNKKDTPWTYFFLEVPRGASGGNIHIRLTSSSELKYQIYARFGGFPSLDSWDYLYANQTTNSDGSMFFKMYNSSGETVSFYILYAKEGTWSFGLRQINPTKSASGDSTTMSISLERCPKRCSSHGTCQSVLDSSGLMLFSYCSCDRNHGGFDCSIEIVSRQGHIWQSVSLIASNAAAIMPAYWALRQKAFAEWVLFTCSGISSGLYHACDVGTWCALSFHVLQFMDFWLSFMAVVSTFVYLAAIDEVSKRTIHTVVAIVTALMAITGATRSANIILVIAIGALVLLVGWLIEFSTNFRSFSFPTGFYLNILDQWEIITRWFHNILKTFLRRFRWGFLLAGFSALAMAAISWKVENSESYWIWHSVWHVSIYTSSFLFLCSKANIIDSQDQGSQEQSYELTRQSSFSRGE